jgi:hypothetical protein
MAVKIKLTSPFTRNVILAIYKINSFKSDLQQSTGQIVKQLFDADLVLLHNHCELSSQVLRVFFFCYPGFQ